MRLTISWPGTKCADAYNLPHAAHDGLQWSDGMHADSGVSAGAVKRARPVRELLAAAEPMALEWAAGSATGIPT